jgi:hypothetical protein
VRLLLKQLHIFDLRRLDNENRMARGDTELGRSTRMPTHTDENDIASLKRWVSDGDIPEAALSRLMSDPRLPEAIRTLAVNGLEASAKDKALDGICKDAGRYFAGMLVVYLHASAQLTLPKLKAYCATT